MAICTSATMPLFFNVPVRGGTPGKILVLKRNVSRLPALLQLGLHFSHSWECPGTLCSLNLKVESVINELQYCTVAGKLPSSELQQTFSMYCIPSRKFGRAPQKDRTREVLSNVRRHRRPQEEGQIATCCTATSTVLLSASLK